MSYKKLNIAKWHDRGSVARHEQRAKGQLSNSVLEVSTLKRNLGYYY